MSPGAAPELERFVTDPDASGPDSLPRRNGELVFEAPWEGRAFGLAVSLARGRAYEWESFRRRLIEEIAAWEESHPHGSEGWSYYERWLAALERLLLEGELLADSEIKERMAQIANQEAHEHDHGEGESP